MFKNNIIFAILGWVLIMSFWFIQNQSLPLGFDHGIYAHLVNIMESSQNIDGIPTYLKSQYEPFSRTFFYVLSLFLGKENLYSWGYLVLNTFIGMAIFILGKNRRSYTIGSLFGIFLFLFSTVQYFNLFWSFGKQLFATFFLLLGIRYQRKTSIALILFSACIALHRLTGFIAIVFIAISLLKVPSKKVGKNVLWIVFGAFIGAITYLLHDSFDYQIRHLLTKNIGGYILLPGSYGTAFSRENFLFYEIPSLLILLLSSTYFYRKNTFKNLLKNTYFIMFIGLSLLVLFRCIGHSRLQSFVDLFLIILMVKMFAEHIKIQWLYVFCIIQIFLWFSFANKWHQPYISAPEDSLIKNIVGNIPNNVKIVTLDGSYLTWLSKYTDHEIYSLKRGIGSKIWSGNDRKFMPYNRGALCKNLEILSGNIYIYKGVKDGSTSTQNNNCLKQIKEWDNGAQFFSYVPSR